ASDAKPHGRRVMAAAVDRDSRDTAEDQSAGEETKSTRRREIDLRFVRVTPTFLIRFAIATVLVAASILIDRPAFAWGVLVLFAVLAVPLGRARSFLFSFVPYA